MAIRSGATPTKSKDSYDGELLQGAKAARRNALIDGRMMAQTTPERAATG